MDLTALLATLNPSPVVVEHTTVTWSGAFVPVVLPLAALPPAQRARLALSYESIPLEVRVGAALDAGLVNEAWALLLRTPGPISRTLGLELTLSAWAGREQARLHLPATRDPILVLTASGKPVPGLEVAFALTTTREMLSALSWPRWAGPVVVVVDDLGDRDPMPGSQRVVRPALPMVRLGTPPANCTRSELLGIELTRLVLELEMPPPGGWPAWLRVGLEQVVQAKLRGEGPSPLKMLGLRQRAGADGLAKLLTDPTPNAELAGALCAPLVHTRRRHLLAKLFDLLRGGGQAAGAIQLAYGLTLAQLTEER
jgi:hypothetical protein